MRVLHIPLPLFFRPWHPTHIVTEWHIMTDSLGYSGMRRVCNMCGLHEWINKQGWADAAQGIGVSEVCKNIKTVSVDIHG